MRQSTRYFRASAVSLLIVLGGIFVFYCWKSIRGSFDVSRDLNIWVVVILLILIGINLIKGIVNLTMALWFKYFERNVTLEKYRRPAELFLVSMAAIPIGIWSLKHGLSGLLYGQVEALGRGPFIPDLATQFTHPIRYWYSLVWWLLGGILFFVAGLFALSRAIRLCRAK